ncbi:MAG: STAS domain-containing protein [Phycisphaerae bacterium]
MTSNSDQLIRETRDLDGARVSSVLGEIDMQHAPALREALSDVVATRPRRLILDMGDVQYIDSTGLGTLVYFLRKINAYQGKMVLTGMSPAVRGVFEITKLINVFSIHDTVEDAAKA